MIPIPRCQTAAYNIRRQQTPASQVPFGPHDETSLKPALISILDRLAVQRVHSDAAGDYFTVLPLFSAGLAMSAQESRGRGCVENYVILI